MLGRTNAQVGGTLQVGDITQLDKSSDSNFLLCDGDILEIGDNGFSSLKTILFNYCGTWTQGTSSFSTADVIYAVTYGNGLYVAVGGSGKLATSTDGITWTQRTSGFGTIIRNVTYGNGLYVAVGDSGKLATSTDGITWTQRTSSFSTNSVYDVTYGNGLYVAVGQSGKLATSNLTLPNYSTVAYIKIA